MCTQFLIKNNHWEPMLIYKYSVTKYLYFQLNHKILFYFIPDENTNILF